MMVFLILCGRLRVGGGFSRIRLDTLDNVKKEVVIDEEGNAYGNYSLTCPCQSTSKDARECRG
jgi:hypothetical protein